MSKAELIHKGKVAALGCAYCNFIHGPHTPGPVELHHFRGGGWGKGDYKTLIPLCPEHHRGKTGVHGLGTKAFDRMSGTTQQELLTWTLERIGC